MTWADAGRVALAVGVETRTVWAWVRSGLVLARRLPGPRGRVRVALDPDGFPVAATPERRSTGRRLRRRP